MDMDQDGMIDWHEFKFYLLWAGRQYPDVRTNQELLDKAFKYGLIPAMTEEIYKHRAKLKNGIKNAEEHENGVNSPIEQEVNTE